MGNPSQSQDIEHQQKSIEFESTRQRRGAGQGRYAELPSKELSTHRRHTESFERAASAHSKEE